MPHLFTTGAAGMFMMLARSVLALPQGHEIVNARSTTDYPLVNANISIGKTIYVKEGDTVWDLAATYRVGVCDLARMNGLADPDFIYPGEKFLIPAESAHPDDFSCLDQNNTETTNTCVIGGPHVYTTMPGDTIQKIANVRYNITVDSILSYAAQTAYIVDLNPGPYTELEMSQLVKIPLCENTECILRTFNFHYGTFVDVAREFGVTTGQIMSLNQGFNHSDGGDTASAALTLTTNCTYMDDSWY
ncbi:hypothetical protein N7493_010352 [Penicillium malachiteum]|uniref:LysM domain-containing protein n=1 Tax=Penicillium malachiteum TaxID=1324776 RepID=A0AAD6HCU6_9EURO|nr:hypothetical protein N7493_010352 [Penicillium malachiteum]